MNGVPPGRFARGLALVVTNATKVAGLVVAVNELLLRTQLRPLALATAGFMMAGAQLSESLILRTIDHLLGGPPEPPIDKPAPGPMAP